MWNRRQLLYALTGAVGAVTLGAVPVLAADGSYDISYLWVPDRDAALDYLDQLKTLLGPDVARDLEVVEGGSGNFGVIYNRTGKEKAAAQRVATAHDRLLRRHLGGSEVLATVVSDQGVQRLWNISYGEPTTHDHARVRYSQVAGLLGKGVHRELVIEKHGDMYLVVYQRQKDHASTSVAAKRHTGLLNSKSITARPMRDRGVTAIWGNGSGDVLVSANVANVPAIVEPRVTESAVKADATAKSDVPDEAAVKADTPDKSEVTKEADPAAKVSTPALSSTLPASIQTPLRDAINEHVQGLRKRGLIAPDETTSWYVHTLNDDRTWAAINAERSLQCASMVKPYVALAFLHQVNKDKIIYGPVSKGKLERMIQRSDNLATNWAIAKVGGVAVVQRILRDHYGKVLEETSIVEAIPTYGRTYKNRSSARDYVRFSRALWAGELPQAKELRRLMALPGRDRITTGAPAIPVGTKVMNKTGSTSHLCGDFGIIVARTTAGKRVPYVFVGIVEKKSRASNYGSWIGGRSRVIRSVSNLTYQVLQGQYLFT
ncbi:MAG: beta-lactamase class A [Kiritimatiellia bacterium]|jgi:beta-lactamase class A